MVQDERFALLKRERAKGADERDVFRGRRSRVFDERVVGFVGLMLRGATDGQNCVMDKPSLRGVFVLPVRQRVQCALDDKPRHARPDICAARKRERNATDRGIVLGEERLRRAAIEVASAIEDIRIGMHD